LGSSSEEKGDSILAALEDDIDYCIKVLKIHTHDDEIKTKIKELLDAQNIALFGIYPKRLVALKTIADFITLTYNTLTQSQLYDFLMLSTTAIVSTEQIRGNKRLQGTTNDIVFKIYGDLWKIIKLQAIL
jgi:hypothetical protein